MRSEARRVQRMTHEGGPDTAVAAIACNGHRSEKQSGLAGAANDVPAAGRADNSLAVRRHEGEVVGRPPSVAQALRAFEPSAFAESFVEQRFARCNIEGSVFSDWGHVGLVSPG